jgi:HD superfamily phosphohydrolase
MVRLDAREWAAVNTPVFQRLRGIKQLAMTDLVYPSATHSRFEHSIGHVAGRLADAVRSVVPDLDQYTLSMAAKVDYIVYHHEADRVPLQEIPKLANQLDWRISKPQVEKSVELLTKLGRLTGD